MALTEGLKYRLVAEKAQKKADKAQEKSEKLAGQNAQLKEALVAAGWDDARIAAQFEEEDSGRDETDTSSDSPSGEDD